LLIITVFIGLSLTNCRSTKNTESSEVKTDLGTVGNTFVLSRFKNYKARRTKIKSGCIGKSEHRRVLITGFGLFSGVSSNISGAVSNSKSSENFFSDSTGMEEIKSSIGTFTRGKIGQKEFGGRTKVRIMNFDNLDYEICFLTLDVIWDLAASIIIDEARQFNPDLIIMTGLNGADENGLTLEGGALNSASYHGSFGADGKRLDIKPRSRAIIKFVKRKAPKVLPMTWDNEKIAKKIEWEVNGIDKNYKVNYPDDARPSNDYICNNISFAVLAAMAGYETGLAGGKIRFKAKKLKAKVGFLHYPNKSRNIDYEVNEWSKIMGLIIAAHFDD
jgi:hypothetical protein